MKCLAVIVALLSQSLAHSGYNYTWIEQIEQYGGQHVLPAGTFYLERQYVLPKGTHLEGSGVGKTVLQAVYTNKTKQGEAVCGPYYVNRIGILLGTNTYVGKFTFTGADYIRPLDNIELCGGAAIEAPGCARPYCGNPHTITEEKGPNVNTGNGHGVRHVLIEDIEFTAETVQNMVYIPQNEPGKAVSSDITMRNLRTNGTLADGINIHGAHKNILVEDCIVTNSGDDAYAAWDAGIDGEFLNNITFRNNYAGNPSNIWNKRDCFTQFGGLDVNFVNNTCRTTTNAMIRYWTQFCGDNMFGPGTRVCYPKKSRSYVSGNVLLDKQKPLTLRDGGNLPHLYGEDAPKTSILV